MTATTKHASRASITSIGVQLGRDRFPRRREAPRISAWRTNLTALSKYNLYIVAFQGSIHVYEPRYPDQSLTSEPALIINTPASEPGLAGYIDGYSPRSINNTLVEHYGTEEVLAVVRDDGDVDAYWTRHIHDAIARRRQPGNTLNLHAVEIRPFLHKNVGHSAWGLAIHAEKRILAVSSNGKRLHVFAPALVHDDEEKVGDGHEEKTDATSSPHAFNSARRRLATRTEDFEVDFYIGEHNIPAIAFCNTGHDPEARWILATNINGITRSFDLLDGRNFSQTVRVGFKSVVEYGFDRENAGWGVMFLDPRSFQEEEDVETATGVNVAGIGLDTNSALWDLSSAAYRVVDSQLSMSFTQAHYQPTSAVVPSDSDQDGMDASNISDTDMEETLPDDDGLAAAAFYPARDVEVTLGNGSESGGRATNNNESEEYVPVSSLPARRYAFGEEDLAPSKALIGFEKNSLICPGLPCPILHASVHNIYLFQPPHQQASSSTPGRAEEHLPVVLLADSMYQDIAGSEVWLDRIERCSLQAQIPELGVVVIGNQKGRVAILSLTKVWQKLETTIGNMKCAPRHRSVHLIRLEHFLPWASQERAGLRGVAPLHGIAVGPMQGSGDGVERSERRRWRLIMYYGDHTVLSYEIARRPNGRIDVGDVMI